SALVILAVFGAAAGVLATTVHSDRSPSVATVVSLVLAYAIAANVEFEVRTGLTLPTELALVPMLFLLPLGDVPLFVAGAMLLAVLLVLPLIGLLAEFARERRVRIDHALELSHAYRGTAMLLGDVVEADDAYTGSHSRDVVSLVLAVCDRLGLDARDRRDAEFAALLHDVGKIKIPAEIINK